MAKSAIPSFKVTPGSVKIGKTVYNSSPQGIGNLRQLRRADYGQSFRQGTFGENLTIAHAGYIHRESEDAEIRKYARQIVRQITDVIKGGILGDTVAYGGGKNSKLIFAQDHPLIRGGQIVMDPKVLESRLGSHQEGEVIFGTHGVRAMPRKCAPNPKWEILPAEIRDSYLILLTGDGQAPEKTAQITEKMGRLIFASAVPSRTRILVPVLVEEDIGFRLEGDGWNDGSRSLDLNGDPEFEYYGRSSFGVRQ